MHLTEIKESLEIPEGVTVETDGRMITVKGEKGEVTRKVGSHYVHVVVEDGKVTFSTKNATRREKRVLRTGKSHTKNILRGVVEGHTYKLKICSGHFPMNVGVKEGVFEVKNFIGEKVPRQLKLKEGCDVQVNGEEIVVEAASKELAGNQASDIELLTRRPGFDSRIFQDGIYITEKDGRPV